MLRANARDNCVYLVHSPEDAQALGAQLIAHAIPDSKFITPEVRAKHPDRAEFFHMNKKNWRANGMVDEFQYDNRDELPFYIVAKLLPYIHHIPRNIKGATSRTDDRTSYHKDRLRKGEHDAAVRSQHSQEYMLDEDMAWNALTLGLETKNQALLSSALRSIWPEADRSIMLRARANPRFTAELLIALNEEKDDKVGAFLDLARPHADHPGIRGCSILAFTSILLYYLGSEFRATVIERLAPGGTFAAGMKGADSVLKPMHEDIRRAACLPAWASDIPGGDYTHLMYMTTLMGRFYDVTKADDGSVNNRTKFPGVHVASRDGINFTYDEHINSMDTALTTLYRAARNALLDKSKKTIDDFQADFLAVASSGSAASGKYELAHVESDARMNKRAWINELSAEDILGICSRPAEVVSNAVNKLELNKIRQLLPGPVWHWLGESIVLWGVENQSYRDNDYIALKKPAPITMARLLDRKERDIVNPGTTTLDMDYADFNITHMITDMQKIYRTIKAAADEVTTTEQTWGDTDYPGFVSRVCDWLIECLENLWMRADGGDGEIHHLIRGLWSGWKSTQFINTNENSNYFNQARDCLAEILGADIFVKAEGQGDDMDAVVTSLVDALIAVNYFQYCGHEMQALKQLIGNKSSEFLRITAHDGTLYGNLSRTIGSFCSADMQAPELENGPVTVQGLSMAVHTMIRRGLDEEIGEIVRSVGIRRFSEIKIYNPATYDYQYHWLEDHEAAISGHDGGLGCAPFATLAPVRSFDPKRDATRLAGTDEDGLLKSVKDWEGAAHLVTKYKGIKSHGAPVGSKNHGINAMKKVISQYMYARGINPDIALEVERAAIDACWEGLRDSSVEREVRTEHKAAIADYYKQCRALSARKPMPEPELDNTQKAVVEDVMKTILLDRNTVLAGDKSAMVEEGARAEVDDLWGSADIEDIVDTAFRLALGPAAVSNGIFKRLRNMGGEKLSVWQALELLDSQASGNVLKALNRFELPEVIEHMMDAGGHTIKDTGGIVAAELNLVIDQVHQAVINNTVIQNSVPYMSYGDWYRLMRATNTHIIRVYRSRYYNQFRL
uniref:RNA-directed RNA polymerase n=1 Tax=Rhizoctonia solani dsRNA virus 7 TaxID=2600103 RepID=A0A5B8HBW5_9VIRU|nr:RNA-dependent RNA polymerase [Rhizoctonia solani dsRNA virus 7]